MLRVHLMYTRDLSYVLHISTEPYTIRVHLNVSMNCEACES